METRLPSRAPWPDITRERQKIFSKKKKKEKKKGNVEPFAKPRIPLAQTVLLSDGLHLERVEFRQARSSKKWLQPQTSGCVDGGHVEIVLLTCLLHVLQT